MISLHSPPSIEAQPGGGYQLCFWILDVFNYDVRFRTMLAEIAEAIGSDPHKDLKLPQFVPDEDFIEGTLAFGHLTLAVYFEHARSYLSLAHERKDVLCDVLAKVGTRWIPEEA